MKRPPNQKLTEDDRKRIMRLLMAGLSTEIVAKRFGVSAKTIRMHWSQKLRKNPAKDDGKQLTDYANGQRLSRTADELDTVGWIAIALRSAKLLFLVNRDHGLQPVEKVGRKFIVLHCGWLHERRRGWFVRTGVGSFVYPLQRIADEQGVYA